MPIDINLLRPEKGGNPDLVRESERMRGKDPQVVDQIIAADQEWRQEKFNMDSLRTGLNAVSRQVRDRKKNDGSNPCTEELARVAELKEQMTQQQTSLEEVSVRRERMLESIGNIVRPGVPDFLEEEHNKVLRRWGVPRKIPGDELGTPGRLNHHQILGRLRGYDPVKGAAVAGYRGYYLKGLGCLLNMALQQYGVQFLVRKGYMPVHPPFFMKKEVMREVAELKDFDETLYKVRGVRRGALCRI
uniref:Serine-tRNA synthetase type1 N-terminal domain-containing protein n=1 Tax=Chromera velia CCMP2878 TaxID=1169474 RepID=A0A0G4I6D8_9ALVE|eukprot:Cvel_1894.t1-p1 / transcript=Cvel_1894.t1 / gene=Cvel_1894 / organism=Chromera_velia_CCMP2878 / gene_product=Serine--tRNA ligase, cytoplasmic, putative / transcript_product=Serine--tRNA ligase, cytoplasmic, putative / location=Cvel_scaffold70:149023-150181(+) / protein_length=244 / sequence_SO=supercontig / SO=protein_coding / is_pseudo=false